MMRPQPQPLAGPTRGRTASGRLAPFDAWVCGREDRLLSSRLPGSVGFLDLGFGEQPWTTLETARAFRALCPALRVVGVDQAPHRVAAAKAHADALTGFVVGGFEALEGLGPARLVRAMNVLRTYREAQVEPAHAALVRPLVDGGVALEGTCDADGGVGVVHLLRRTGAGHVREALVFHTNFRRGFSPWMFRDWLPRDLRRRVRPGEQVHALLTAWAAAWAEARSAGAIEPAHAFAASARGLAERVEGVRAEAGWLARGFVCFAPPEGVSPPGDA